MNGPIRSEDTRHEQKTFEPVSMQPYDVTGIVTGVEIRSDYRSFAEAMFDDMKKRTVDSLLAILSMTRGVISIKTAEQTLGVDRINRMKKTGHIHQLVSHCYTM